LTALDEIFIHKCSIPGLVGGSNPSAATIVSSEACYPTGRIFKKSGAGANGPVVRKHAFA